MFDCRFGLWAYFVKLKSEGLQIYRKAPWAKIGKDGLGEYAMMPRGPVKSPEETRYGYCGI